MYDIHIDIHTTYTGRSIERYRSTKTSALYVGLLWFRVGLIIKFGCDLPGMCLSKRFADVCLFGNPEEGPIYRGPITKDSPRTPKIS